MNSHADIISLWPNYAALADDLGVKVHAVQKWKLRDSIPGEWWAGTVRSAAARKIEGVTLEALAAYAAEKAGTTPTEQAA